MGGGFTKGREDILLGLGKRIVRNLADEAVDCVSKAVVQPAVGTRLNLIEELGKGGEEFGDPL